MKAKLSHLSSEAMLVTLERENHQKEAQPTVNTIDTQSVRIAPMISEDKGIDGNKKVNGRKRHLITGLIIAVMVHAANHHDGTAGCRFFERVATKLQNTKKFLPITFTEDNLEKSFLRPILRWKLPQNPNRKKASFQLPNDGL